MLNDRLSARGGADRHLLALLDNLRGRAETLLAVGFADDSLGRGELGRAGAWLRLKNLDCGGLSRRGLKACLTGLKEIARDFRPDLIHLHNVMHPGIIAAAGGLGPALMTIQDHRVFCPGSGKITPDGGICQRVLSKDCGACFGDHDYGRRMLLLTLDRLAAVSRLDRVFVLSAYMKDQLSLAFAGHGLPCPPITVLPPFVHGLARAPAGAGGGYHLLACRLTKTKGVQVALKAFELLRRPDRLVVAGDGTLAGEVRERAAKSGGRLRYLPWADRAGMSRLLAGAVSVWLPSLWAEPFGIAGLEAMHCARPVIASRVGGVTDWLKHGENGFLVRPGDPRELALAADRLSGDARLADRMGRAGRQSVKVKFDRDRLMAGLMEEYRYSLEPV